MMEVGSNLDEYRSRRSVVFSSAGMVASNQPFATMAGCEVLQDGGTAADAALSVAAALQVLEPHSTGLGGDVFWMYFDAATGRMSAVNGSGHSPSELTLHRAVEAAKGEQRIPELHPYCVTVPGAPAAWQALHDRFGRLPRAKVLKKAIALAELGFPVAPMTAYLWRKHGPSVLGKTQHGRDLLLHGGRGPAAGEILKLPFLAESLSVFADHGAEPFYRGSVARAIVSTVRREGGILSEADLAEYAIEEVTPIGVQFRERIVWELPPNGQGIVALLALNILAERGRTDDFGADAVHAQIEATRIAAGLANQVIADPRFATIPVKELLSSRLASKWSRRISATRSDLDAFEPPIMPDSGSDTVYFCVADRDGSICSFINSIYSPFGSGIVPARAGFALQNRARGFVLAPNHPNVVAPSKRRSTFAGH